MREERYGLLDVLQHADEQMVYEAGKPWMGEKKKGLASWGTRAACVLLVAVIGLTGIFHGQAAAAISRFTTYLSEWLGNERNLLPYTEVVNQSQTNNGVSMTLREVIVDENRMLVSVETAFEEESQKEVDFEDLWGYIGAVWINGAYMDSVNIIGSQTEDPNRYVMEYFFEEGTLPAEISEVKLLVSLAKANEDGRNEPVAEFTFAFTAAGDQLRAETAVIPIDVDMKTEEGITLHLQDLAYTDIGGRLSVRCSADPRVWYEEGEIRWYDIPYRLVIEDDQDHVMFYCPVSNLDEDEEVREIIFDSDWGTPPAADARYLKIRLYRQECTPYSEAAEMKQEDEEDYIPEFPQQIGEEIRKEIR